MLRLCKHAHNEFETHPYIKLSKRKTATTRSHININSWVTVEVMSVREVAMSGVGVIMRVRTFFSEITGCVLLICTCLLISYITHCTGIKQAPKTSTLVSLGRWEEGKFLCAFIM